MTSPSSPLQPCRKLAILTRSLPLLPAISLVVVQPQQTRSLTSAADSLPTILRRIVPNDTTQSSTTPMSIESRDQPSTAADNSTEPPLNAIHESNQSVLVHQDPAPGAPGTVSGTLSTDEPPFSIHPSGAPTVVSQDSAATQSLSNKRFWLNVFSWTGGKQSSIAEVTVVQVNSAQEALHSVHTCVVSSENTSSPDPHETIKLADQIESNSGTDLPLPFGDSTPRRPHSTSILAPDKHDASSPREEQPISQSSTNPVPDSPVPQTRQGTSPAVANNSTGTFALKFPRLARSSPRRETVVTTHPSESSAEPTCELSVTAQGAGNTYNTNSINVVEPTCTTSISTVLVPECNNQTPTDTIVTETRTNTWMSYLGWNGTSSAAPTEPSARNEQLFGANSDTSSAVPVQPPTESSPEGEVIARADLSPDVTEGPLSNDKKSPSAQSADSPGIPLGPAWYAPWSWYQSSSSATTTTTTTTTTAILDMNTGSQQDPLECSQIDPVTEEKRSTGDRGAPTTPNQSPQDASVTEPVDYRNPIQSVISTNPTGWMSFFAAKAIAMKSITYEKEEGKMEIMEIDDEMVPESNSAPSSVPTATQSSPTQVTKPFGRAQPDTSDIPLPSSPPPKKSDDKRFPVAHAVTNPETVVNDTLKRQPSPSPSKKSSMKAPTSPPPANLVLPTWNDTFYTLPRSVVPREPPSALSKTLQYVSGVLFSREEAPSNKGKGKAKEPVYSPYDRALPRTWDVFGGGQGVDVLRGCKRVVIIGVHGWFPGAVLRTLAGEPTGTSSKFVSGIMDALDSFQEQHKVKLEKITKIPLEGEGTINRRVERLYQNLLSNKGWMEDLHDADAIFIATHSQGSVVSTHLLDRLITDRHIRTSLNADASIPAGEVAAGSVTSIKPLQRICCLALCGIHLGPLRYLGTSSLVQPYIQYFESTAARELFEFQNTESPISRDYVRALRNVLNNGIKMVYIASLTDQVVGLYSGLFTAVSHPLILRALYIDGDTYHPSDFLSNLLVLLLRIRNAGLSDGGLLTHLSEVTAGSLNGIGHSTPYEERATYSLAVNYLFLTDNGSGAQVEFVEEPFNALAERNDYEIPWALRDLIADEKVASLFSDEFVALRDAFRDWHPKTGILRDVKRKLQPIQRLSSALIASHSSRL